MNKSTKVSTVVAFGTCLASLASCVAEVGSEPNENPGEPIGTAESPLATLAQFSWSQGQPPQNLSKTQHPSSVACLLSRVAGDFNGGGERVQVRINNNGTVNFTSDDFWELSGTSGVPGGGLSATTRCISRAGLGMTGEVQFFQSQGQSIALPPDINGAGGVRSNCFLTMLTGNFKGGGESVSVRAGNDNKWHIDITSGQSGVGGGAVCLTGTSLPGITNFPFRESFLPFQGTQSLPVSNTSGINTCFLMKMTGEFNGSGEQISAVSGSPWNLALSGFSFNRIGGAIGCI